MQSAGSGPIPCTASSQGGHPSRGECPYSPQAEQGALGISPGGRLGENCAHNHLERRPGRPPLLWPEAPEGQVIQADPPVGRSHLRGLYIAQVLERQGPSALRQVRLLTKNLDSEYKSLCLKRKGRGSNDVFPACSAIFARGG